MKSTTFRRLSLLLLVSPLSYFTLPVARAAEWADLKMTFVYDSDELPLPATIDMARDPWCVTAHTGKVMTEALVVDPDSKGIANVCVYPDPKGKLEASDAHPDLMKQAATPPVLDNVNCVFVPHVFSVVAGGSVIVKNSDQTGHNANFNFFANDAANKIIPIGGSQQFDVKKAERAPTPIDCNIHPWMKAYLIVAETPYVGISNTKGELLIEKLLADKELKLKIWHEASDGFIEKATLDGKEIAWKKGVIEVTLKPGMNDMGIVKLPASTFKAQ